MQIKVASNVPELGDHLNDEALVKIDREFSRLAGERKQAPARPVGRAKKNEEKKQQ